MITRCLVVLMCCIWAQCGNTKTINIAVASNFAAPMQRLIEKFEHLSGHQIRVSYGSSGKFFAQISHGAPFDLFFSADQIKPTRLVDNQLAVSESQFTYAQGVLVLWTPGRSLGGHPAATLEQLHVDKLALANPRLAPYGQAAQQALKDAALASIASAHQIMGENIAQTFQFLYSGNVPVGFVAWSQVLNRASIESDTYWLIPQHLYAPIKQDAVRLTQAQSPAIAGAFLTFIRSDEAQRIIRKSGYTLPAEERID